MFKVCAMCNVHVSFELAEGLEPNLIRSEAFSGKLCH